MDKLDTKGIENSDFLSILYSKAPRDYRKPVFKLRHGVRTSKQDPPYRKCYKPRLRQEVFEAVAVSPRKHPTYTVKKEQDEIFRGNVYHIEMINLI